MKEEKFNPLKEDIYLKNLLPKEEKFKLSDKKICVGDVKLGTLNEDLPYYVYPKEDVKHHIQRAEKRLKDELEVDTFPELENKINKIFFEEFGEELR